MDRIVYPGMGGLDLAPCADNIRPVELVLNIGQSLVKKREPAVEIGESISGLLTTRPRFLNSRHDVSDGSDETDGIDVELIVAGPKTAVVTTTGIHQLGEMLSSQFNLSSIGHDLTVGPAFARANIWGKRECCNKNQKHNNPLHGALLVTDIIG